jgi:long-chain acyl-CoA synthetase
MPVRTLAELFQRAVHDHGPRTAIRYHRDEAWHPITYGQLGRLVEEAALGLHRAGVDPGQPVVVAATSGPQAAIADLACLHVGAPVLALDPSADRETHAAAPREADAVAAFVPHATGESEAWPAVDELELVVTFEATPGKAEAEQAEPAEGRLTMTQLYRRGQQAAREGASMDDLLSSLQPADAAHLAPTGSGELRALTHAGLLHEVRGLADAVELAPGGRCLSLLALGEPLHRASAYACHEAGGELWLADAGERLPEDLAEARPDVLVGPPAAYRRLRGDLEERLEASEATQRRLFSWARSVGAERERARRDGGRVGLGLRFRHRLAEGIVLGQARAALGLENAQAALVEGGLEPELSVWLRSLGVPVRESFRPPASAGLVAVQRAGGEALDSRGAPLAGVEIREGDDGELRVRGPAAGTVFPVEDGGGQAWVATGHTGRVAGGRVRLDGDPPRS